MECRCQTKQLDTIRIGGPKSRGHYLKGLETKERQVCQWMAVGEDFVIFLDSFLEVEASVCVNVGENLIFLIGKLMVSRM